MKSWVLEQIYHQRLLPHHIEYLKLDRDLHILDTSKQVQRFAVCPEEVIQNKDVRVSFPEIVGIEDILIAILEGKQEYFELKGISRCFKHGYSLYIDIYVTSYFSYQEDKSKKIIIIIEDVTERMVLQQSLVHRSNEADILLKYLVASQNYIERILMSMADALLVTTPDGKIKKVNQATLDLFGYSEAELINQSISIITKCANFLLQVKEQHFSSSSEFLQEYEVICYTKTGEEVCIAFSAAIIQTDKENSQYIYIGRNMTERKQRQERLFVEHATTRILSESATVVEATPKILQAICETLGWERGELWRLDEEANMLRYVESWHKPSLSLSEFDVVTRQSGFGFGEGLPGRVWASRNPVWINDVVDDANFLRQACASREGLHAAFGFPILNGNEVLGVMTFFSDKIQSPRKDLLETMVVIGNQIGQFIKRKQAEIALQESQDRFQAFMNNSPTVAFMKDSQGRNVYVNKQLEQVFQVKQADLLGKTDFEWLPEETAKQVLENDILVLSTGKTVQLIETVPTPDGIEHYWLVFKFPFTDSHGKQFIGGVAVDITDRRRLEEELFQEKELAQVTLQSIGDAVITTDTNGNIKSFNSVAQEITGWKEHEAIMKPLPQVFRIVNETTRELVENPIKKVLHEDRIVSLAKDTVLITRYGVDVAINASAALIRNQHGEIFGGVLVFQDVTHSRRMERQLSWEASHDVLTGLFNRREFENRLQQIITTARRENQQHALCYLDLDKFKIVNDTCGHAAGDELLRQVTALFLANVRSSDIIARLGGDEFALLLTHCPLESAVQIADKLRKCIQEYRFGWQDKVFQIGVSIGLVAIDADSQSLASVLSAADAACYAAKNQGRNRVHVVTLND